MPGPGHHDVGVAVRHALAPSRARLPAAAANLLLQTIALW